MLGTSRTGSETTTGHFIVTLPPSPALARCYDVHLILSCGFTGAEPGVIDRLACPGFVARGLCRCTFGSLRLEPSGTPPAPPAPRPAASSPATPLPAEPRPSTLDGGPSVTGLVLT